MLTLDQKWFDANAGRLSPETLALAAGRLGDRGIDPDQILGRGESSGELATTHFYVMLGSIAASEKAGQGPTHAFARLALRSGLPSEIADTLFLAYNQQSAEEAGHGDKVFGNAYYAMGGYDAGSELSVFDIDAAAPVLQTSDDPKANKQRLGGAAALLGGVETVALQRTFPMFVALCEQWDHPIARDLLMQVRDVVRPEESRHVLLWRYVFHQLIASKGEKVIDFYHQTTNAGRQLIDAAPLDREAFLRLVGTTAPTPRQLLGKDRAELS